MQEKNCILFFLDNNMSKNISRMGTAKMVTIKMQHSGGECCRKHKEDNYEYDTTY